ncbi:MAG: folate-binding protein YgfZ [Chloroflexi bacterium]|nr:folate-binding protein YgfZ [Chloroflexota bacterium]
MTNWYQQAHNHAVWTDESSRGRLLLSDRDRLDLIHRLSTNDVLSVQVGQGTATIFTTAVGRIIDKVVVLNRGETTFLITGQGRQETIENWLKRNVFWNDRLAIENVAARFMQIGIFGPKSTEVLAEWWPQVSRCAVYQFIETTDPDKQQPVILVRVPDIAGGGFWLIASPEFIGEFKQALTERDVTEIPSSAYDALRIEAGLAASGHELTGDYIPLEVGQWDAVSFNKGCYTGQEIIARMESRGKLAKMMVQITFDAEVQAGDTLTTIEGKPAGQITSVATRLPDVEKEDETRLLGLAVVKAALAEPGQQLVVQSGETKPGATIIDLAGDYEPTY